MVLNFYGPEKSRNLRKKYEFTSLYNIQAKQIFVNKSEEFVYVSNFRKNRKKKKKRKRFHNIYFTGLTHRTATTKCLNFQHI